MLEKKIESIWIVVHDFNLGEPVRQFVKKMFPDSRQWTCCREHLFKNEINHGTFPDLLITNGYCKKLDFQPPYPTSIVVKCDGLKQTVKEKNIPIISPTFFGKYIPQVMAFRLEKYRS